MTHQFGELKIPKGVRIVDGGLVSEKDIYDDEEEEDRADKPILCEGYNMAKESQPYSRKT